MSAFIDNIIIGAGISGLCLANGLQRLQKEFLVLEKSKGIGGRIATRRDGLSTFDHGAQFVKLKPNASFFADQVWTQSKFKKLWFSDSKYNYFCSEKGMTSLAKAIASDLPIELSQKVVQIQKKENHWELICESGIRFESQSVFITAPTPQALELLQNSNIVFPAELFEITYAKALVGLFEIEDHSELNQLSYQQNCNENIFSISNQRSKKISEILALTVVMQPAYSSEFFEKSDSEILEDITQQFNKYFTSPIVIKKAQLKKWRYSHPLKTSNKLFLSLESAAGIYLLGDGFGGPQILGACNSAEALLHFLSSQSEHNKN